MDFLGSKAGFLVDFFVNKIYMTALKILSAILALIGFFVIFMSLYNILWNIYIGNWKNYETLIWFLTLIVVPSLISGVAVLLWKA